jgi:hypothetical protein
VERYRKIWHARRTEEARKETRRKYVDEMPEDRYRSNDWPG